ncbi:MAG: HepT-like ribonuclease domain-containing protein [Bacteroidia bacterium]
MSSFEQYQKDFKTQSAVERQLGIIGEAVNKFEKISGNQLEHSRQISGLRNRIIHAYDSIDNTIVWAILKNHILMLRAEVERRLNV